MLRVFNEGEKSSTCVSLQSIRSAGVDELLLELLDGLKVKTKKMTKREMHIKNYYYYYIFV